MTARTIATGGNQGRGDPPMSRAAAELDEIRAASMRGWWLEFDAAGSPLVWHGLALSEAAAERLARIELAADHPEWNAAARLTMCIERPAA